MPENRYKQDVRDISRTILWVIATVMVAFFLVFGGASGATLVGKTFRNSNNDPIVPTDNLVVQDDVQPEREIKRDTPGTDPLTSAQTGLIVQSADSSEEEVDEPSRPSVHKEKRIPSALLLENVPVGQQTRPLNCEFQSASDLVWYYGYPWQWDEIFEYTGHDPGGNPHVGFVGRSFDDSPGQLYPNGYGVYAEPIARALNEVGLNAEVHYGQSSQWLKEQLAEANPVMVWATAYMNLSPIEYWTAQDGTQVKAVRGEHTYLVIGYDDHYVWVADPADGQRHSYAWATFLDSWGLFDRMSLIINDETDRQTQ